MLESFVVRNVQQRSIATTDGFASYSGLPSVGIGHQAHNTSEPGVIAIKVLARIHKVFSLFKRVVLGTFHGSVSHKHLSKYLDEFRFNRASASRWVLFQRVIEAGAGFRGPTIKSYTQPMVVA
ncbi:MAG: transposase [Archangium sp.]|nr:transposase [Archangium sp.]